jgi:hypothetical protein
LKEKNPQRLYVGAINFNKIYHKIKSELYGDIKRLIEILIHHENGSNKKFRQMTKLSVMPCRLNGDVHEWLNEVVTVPSQVLPNSFTSEETSIA